MQKNRLHDIWRVLNPEAKQYTWIRYLPTPQFSRLDFFSIAEDLMSTVKSCKTMLGFKADRSFVEMVISENCMTRGKGLWKFNATLLEKPEFVFKIHNTIELAEKRYVECNHALKWEMMKCQMIKACQSYAVENAKKDEENLNFLCKKLSEIQEKIQLEPNKDNIMELKVWKMRLTNRLTLRLRVLSFVRK